MNFEYNDERQLIHPNEQNKFMQHSDRLGALIRRCADLMICRRCLVLGRQLPERFILTCQRIFGVQKGAE
jgi:hypothetical protein